MELPIFAPKKQPKSAQRQSIMLLGKAIIQLRVEPERFNRFRQTFSSRTVKTYRQNVHNFTYREAPVREQKKPNAKKTNADNSRER
jgi:hypothetical protein